MGDVQEETISGILTEQVQKLQAKYLETQTLQRDHRAKTELRQVCDDTVHKT
jgi:hypothetical protein